MLIRFGTGLDVTTHAVVKVLRTLPPAQDDEVGECIVQISPAYKGVTTITVPQDCIEE